MPRPSIHNFNSLEHAKEREDFTAEFAASLFDMRPTAIKARRAALN
jgi:hypothetical protein